MEHEEAAREIDNTACCFSDKRFRDAMLDGSFVLIDKSGRPYLSAEKGLFGGNCALKIYGRLDCPSALRALSKGQYKRNRVFFADEETAVSAGYRPCGVCMRSEYSRWKKSGSE